MKVAIYFLAGVVLMIHVSFTRETATAYVVGYIVAAVAWSKK